MNWVLLIIGIIILIIIIRVETRGFFWKDREGNQLTYKQFIKRWKSGVLNITPLQQTKTSLWSFLPIFAGLIWGIAVTFVGGTWWLSLILLGSLPLTSIQFISTLQRYKAQKIADTAFKEAMGIKPKRKKK